MITAKKMDEILSDDSELNLEKIPCFWKKKKKIHDNAFLFVFTFFFLKTTI